MFKKYRKILNTKMLVIIIGTFMTVLTYSMMIPYFAIYLKEKILLSATAAASIIMVFTGFRRQVALVGGFLIDRFGYKKMFILGLFIHVIFYTGFAFSTTYVHFFIFAVISICGGALTIPTIRVLTAASVDDEYKTEAFGLRMVVYDFASMLGPAVGSIVISYSSKILFLSCATTYFLYLLLVAFFFDDVEKPSNSVNIFKGILDIRRNKAAIHIIIASLIFFVLLSQLSSTIPMHIKSNLMLTNGQIAILFTISSVCAVVFQQLIIAISSKYSDGKGLLAGLVTLTIGISIFIFSHSFTGMIISFLVITLSQMICLPILYAIMIKVAPENVKGTYSGIATFAEGIGMASGIYVGGLLLDRINPTTMWIGLTVFGIVGICYFTMFGMPAIDAPKTNHVSVENVKA